ncbi:MAG: hypothetical protein EOM20_19295 [Spartobacteria bacterium]|nr:hypothetical protein [Spartobacteria bacterium]
MADWRSRKHEVWRGVAALLAMVRRFPGLLLLVPIVAAVYGSYWLFPLSAHPVAIRHFLGAEQGNESRAVEFARCPEGQLAEDELMLYPWQYLELEFQRPLTDFDLAVQIRGRDRCVVEGSENGKAYRDLWRVSRQRAAIDQWSTRSEEFRLGTPVRFLHISAAKRRDTFMISDVRVVRRIPIRHAWFIWLFWVVIGGLYLLARLPRLEAAASRTLAFLARCDFPLTAILCVSILFQFTSLMIILVSVFLLVILVIQLARLAVRRVPFPALVFNVGFIILFFAFLPSIVEQYITYRTASEYHLDVDHRMKPNGEEVNMDGIRFKGDAADIRAEDFTILFLGDSFTYGMKLPYEACVPYQTEALLKELYPEDNIRVVNFGWVSSSPLLSYRLLMDIGEKYKPDLVVFLLDMTDFHDDLKYMVKIANREGVKLSDSLIIDNIIDRFMLKFMSLSSQLYLKQQFRSSVVKQNENTKMLSEIPVRYFATNLPLEETRSYFEKGVMHNLEEMNTYCRTRLGVPMTVVLVPRAFQYSTREVPKDYEAHLYTIKGPCVLNPNKYFREIKETLPYPFLDLLPTFAQSEAFPLFFEDDPHWNENGARLAAETIITFLKNRELLPAQ